MYRKVFSICCLFFLCLLVQGQGEESPQVLFQKANKAYRDGQFSEAVKIYEQLLTEQWASADLYYNLGSSYLQLNRLGPAILYLERAFLQSPGDEDISHNLEVARSRLTDDISEIPPFFLSCWWQNASLAASATLWAILGLLLLVLGAAGLLRWMTAPSREQRKRGFLLGLPLLLLGFIPILLAFNRQQLEENSDFAILQAPEVALQAAPDEGSSVVFDLHEGTKVRILDAIGEWYKVRLPNGDQGWLPEEAMERI